MENQELKDQDHLRTAQAKEMDDPEVEVVTVKAEAALSKEEEAPDLVQRAEALKTLVEKNKTLFFL